MEKALERIQDSRHQRVALERDEESLVRLRAAREKEIEAMGGEDQRLGEQIARIKGEMEAISAEEAAPSTS